MLFAYIASIFFCLQVATQLALALHPDECEVPRETALSCPVVDKELAHRLRESPKLSFAQSQWIWTPEVVEGRAPPGSRVFRKNFISPYKRVPAFATIAFGADDAATLWVNGEAVDTEIGWGHARSFCVPLRPHLNVFAVNATNNGNVNNAAGFILTSIITYMDGTTSSLVSDTTWRGETNVPGRDELSFAPARWIWTEELSDGKAPPGARAFRLTVNLPPRHTSARVQILATADDYLSFYVNGVFAGSAIQYLAAQRFDVDVQGPRIVFAVYAENKVLPGGWNPAVTHDWFTDAGWKAYTGEPPYGFELSHYDDSSWSYAVVRDRLPGRVSMPVEMDEPGTPLPGAPRGVPSHKSPSSHSDPFHRQRHSSGSFHSQSSEYQSHFDSDDRVGGPKSRSGGVYADSGEFLDQPAGPGSQSLHECECVLVNGRGQGQSKRVYMNT
ncbi:hypothetical protein BT96DRAFT_919805, partial [Gymnopus androsaceus JB14]